MSTFQRYVFYQIPGWIIAAAVLWFIHAWFHLSLWLAGAILAVFIAKDFALYRKLRRAYEHSAPATANLVGRTAVAVQTLAPAGYVQIDAELWKAELMPGASRVDAGTTVVVEAARGLTLVVRPAGQHSVNQPESSM